MTDEQLLDNLRDHFSRHIRKAVDFTVETCRSEGLEVGSIVALVTIPLLCEAVVAVSSVKLDKARFMTLCGDVYDELIAAQQGHVRSMH